MIANYHTHTYRCRHAVGAEEAYVQRALEGGLQTLGFSDHTPYWFPGGYYTHMRMYPDELPGYIRTVRALRRKYVGQIKLLLGLEVEYYPAFFPELILRLQDAGIEYILLGQHWPGNEMNETYIGRPTESESVLRRYCDQTIEAMETGLFTYLAHPDVVHFVGDRKVYESHMRRLCQAAKDTDTPVEINFQGFRSNRYYPNPWLWPIVGEVGCKVVLGCDAHEPEFAWDPCSEEKAMALVRENGLNLLETVPLRSID